jgi:hypothetical protein
MEISHPLRLAAAVALAAVISDAAPAYARDADCDVCINFPDDHTHAFTSDGGGIVFDNPHSDPKDGHCGYTDVCGHDDCEPSDSRIIISAAGSALDLLAFMIQEPDRLVFSSDFSAVLLLDCDGKVHSRVPLERGISRVVRQGLERLLGQ